MQITPLNQLQLRANTAKQTQKLSFNPNTASQNILFAGRKQKPQNKAVSRVQKWLAELVQKNPLFEAIVENFKDAEEFFPNKVGIQQYAAIALDQKLANIQNKAILERCKIKSLALKTDGKYFLAKLPEDEALTRINRTIVDVFNDLEAMMSDDLLQKSNDQTLKLKLETQTKPTQTVLAHWVDETAPREKADLKNDVYRCAQRSGELPSDVAQVVADVVTRGIMTGRIQLPNFEISKKKDDVTLLTWKPQEFMKTSPNQFDI